jgi:ABC-type transport system substrate-binding protein
VFGSRHGTPEGMNPITHKLVNGKIVRRSLDEAKQLLAEAGYPDGRDAASGRPLVLNYDYQRSVTPELKAELDWMVKQFAKLGIQLEIRATDFNQFQDKILQGKHQIFWYGWLADYPDAENFLFLLYGPNSKSLNQGENTANYANPEYDRLFRTMKALDNGPEKQKIIDQMVALLQKDAPWAWGYFPFAGGAYQSWLHNGKPSVLINDRALYWRVDPARRAQLQAQWNHPVWWPLVLIFAVLASMLWVARRSYMARERVTAKPVDEPLPVGARS